MKNKILFLVLSLFAFINVNGQVKLRSDNSFMIGYEKYTPLHLGYYTSQGYNNGTWAIEWYENGLNIWKPWPSVNAGNYKFFIDDATGNIGIGRRPTMGKLDVAGDIAINGSIKVSSDARLKSNIVDLTDCMGRLSKLNGKSYNKKIILQGDYNLENVTDSVKYRTMLYENNHKKNEAGKKEFGFLAQELNDIFPELVQKDSAGYMYIDYIGLIPVIVEALKDQKKFNDDQGTQIQELQKLLKKDSDSALKSAAIGPNTEVVETSEIPTLNQNAPNPFNKSTEIGYFLLETTKIANLYIYNMNGLQIKLISIQTKGKGNVTINASEFQPGMYIYTLVADGQEVDTRRMILTE